MYELTNGANAVDSPHATTGAIRHDAGMTPAVHLRLYELHAPVAALAEAESRPLVNMIRVLVREAVEARGDPVQSADGDRE